VPLPSMASVASVRVPAPVEELVSSLLSADATKRPADTSAVLSQIEGLLLLANEGRLPLPSRSALSSAIFPEERRDPSRAQVIPKVPDRRRSRLGRVSRAAFLALVFGAVGVVSAIFLVGAVVDKRKQAVSPEAKLTEPAPPVLDVPDVEPDIEAKIARAREGGIPALEKLAADYPTEGLVRAELALALAKAERYEEAVDFSRLALALDPMLNESPKVAGALFRSAQSVKARSATFRLLQGPMGAAGVGIIYDLARTEGPSPRVRAQAEELLKDQEVRAAASPSLRLVLDLEVAKTCEEVSALVLRAALVGDRRALPHLKNLEVTTGCGAQKKDDCYACLRGKTELASAIRTIAQRVTLVEETTDDAAHPGKDKAQPDEAVP
jgi:tetratricopeptide (TPR) repeat protein